MGVIRLGYPVPVTDSNPASTDRPQTSPGASPAAERPAPAGGRKGGRGDQPGNMIPARSRRGTAVERLLVRFIATAGIVGIGVVIAAIMVSQHSQGWLVGLVVSIVSVVLAGILWSSRRL